MSKLTDEERRRRANARTREYWQRTQYGKRRVERQRARRAANPIDRRQYDHGEPMLNGKEVAAELGVDRSTITGWHRRKLIPAPKRVGYVCWYSRRQVELLKLLAGLYGGLTPERNTILEHIRDHW